VPPRIAGCESTSRPPTPPYHPSRYTCSSTVGAAECTYRSSVSPGLTAKGLAQSSSSDGFDFPVSFQPASPLCRFSATTDAWLVSVSAG